MFDERFARQYRYEPPSGFPLTSLCTGIVHHLSGPNRYAPAQSPSYSSVSAYAAACAWHITLSFRVSVCHQHTRIYARLLGPCFKTGRKRPLSQNRPKAPQTGRSFTKHTTGFPARMFATKSRRFHPVFPLLYTPPKYSLRPHAFDVREN
jgi:hypothetical protein